MGDDFFRVMSFFTKLLSGFIIIEKYQKKRKWV